MATMAPYPPLLFVLASGTLQLGLCGSGIPAHMSPTPSILSRALDNEAVAASDVADELALWLRRALSNICIARPQNYRLVVVEPPLGLPFSVSEALTHVARRVLGFGDSSSVHSSIAHVVSAGIYSGLSVCTGAVETIISPIAAAIPLIQAHQMQLPFGADTILAAVALQALIALAPQVDGMHGLANASTLQTPFMTREAAHAYLNDSRRAARASLDIGRQPLIGTKLHEPNTPSAAAALLGWAEIALSPAGSRKPTAALPTALAPLLTSPPYGGSSMPANSTALHLAWEGVPPAPQFRHSVVHAPGDDSCCCFVCNSVAVAFAQSQCQPIGDSAAAAVRAMLSAPALVALEGSASKSTGVMELAALSKACRAVLWHSLPDVGVSVGSALWDAVRASPIDVRRSLVSSIVLAAQPAAPLPGSLPASTAVNVAALWHRVLAQKLLRDAAGLAQTAPSYAFAQPLASRLRLGNTVPPSAVTWAGASALGSLLGVVPLKQTDVDAAALAAVSPQSHILRPAPDALGPRLSVASAPAPAASVPVKVSPPAQEAGRLGAPATGTSTAAAGAGALAVAQPSRPPLAKGAAGLALLKAQIAKQPQQLRPPQSGSSSTAELAPQAGIASVASTQQATMATNVDNGAAARTATVLQPAQSSGVAQAPLPSTVPAQTAGAGAPPATGDVAARLARMQRRFHAGGAAGSAGSGGGAV